MCCKSDVRDSRHMNFVQFKSGSYKDEKYAKGHFPTHLLIGFDSPFTKRGAQTSVRRAFFKGSEEREKNHLHERERQARKDFQPFHCDFTK